MKMTGDTPFRRSMGAVNKAAIGILVALIALIVIGIIVAVVMMPKAVMKGSPLAVFYPESTLFYGELNVTDAKMKELQDLSGNAFTPERIISAIKQSAQKPEDAQQAVKVYKEINESLKPIMAFGFWGEMNEETRQPQNIVFSAVLKDDANVQEMMTNIAEKDVTFTKTDYNGYEIYVSEGKDDGVYTKVDNFLLISNKAETLHAAIDQYKAGGKNVLSNPKAKESLAHLPKERMITLLVNSEDIAKLTEAQKNGKMPEALSNKVKQMQDVFSTMSYTGIAADLHKDIFEARSYTPYNLDVIKDEDLKETVTNLLNAKAKTQALAILPESALGAFSVKGLNHLFRIMILVSDEQELAAYNQQKMMLKMMADIDLEQDLLQLFSQELTISAELAGEQIMPTIFITKKEESLSVLAKIFKEMAVKLPGTAITDEKVGATEFKVAKSAAMPFQLAYGALNDVIAVGRFDSLQKVAAEDAKSIEKTDFYASIKPYMPDESNVLLIVNFESVAKNMEKMLEMMKQGKKKLSEQELAAAEMQIQEFQKLAKQSKGFVMTIKSENNAALVGSMALKLNPKAQEEAQPTEETVKEEAAPPAAQ